MQPATEAGDVFSLAATLYALIAGSPPRSVGAAPVVLEQMFEVANRPIGQLPWVNWYLTDALMTALSIDPAARPTAARFRDQLANVPAPRMSKRGLHVGAAEDASSVSRGWRPVVPEHSTTSNGHSVAVAAITADSQPAPGQVETLEAPRRRGRRREGVLAVAAALITVVASVTAWMINEPASSVVSPTIIQSATPGGLTSSSASSPASDPKPTRPRHERLGSRGMAGSSRRRQALPNRSDPRYVPRCSRYFPAGAALGGRQVAGPPVTHKDQPDGPVHRLCRVGATGSLPASRARPRLRRNVQTL